VARARGWHDCGVTSIADHYDRLAVGYERWWAPVLAPAARGLADELASLGAERPDACVLDVGTGTGTLAIELVQRFPALHVTGADASGGMLDEARATARRSLSRDDARRLDFVRAEAAELPFDDGAFDAVVSSFVFQIVPNRHGALREVRRVLRRDGLVALVTWLGDDTVFEPDEALEDAIDELALDLPDEPGDGRSGNFTSPASAAAQVRRAGFRDVRAHEDRLVHHYDPATYLAFLEQYAEHALFEDLERDDRDRLRDETRRRLARLAPDKFTWRMPVVTVVARRNR